jgi:hypothetical protein
MDEVNDTLEPHKCHRDDVIAAERVILDSVALVRLIEEVRVGPEVKLDAYNRTYHRHNR